MPTNGPHSEACADAAPGTLCDCDCGGTRHGTTRSAGHRPAAGAVTRRAQHAAARAGLPATTGTATPGPARSTATPAQIRATVADFTYGGNGSGSIQLNAALRGRRDLDATDRDLRDHMDTAFAAQPPSTTTQLVYRRISRDPALRRQLLKIARERGTYTDPGYQSTTTDRDTADDFAAGDIDDVLLQISVMPGNRTLDIAAHADHDTPGFYDQHEIVLNRGTTIRLSHPERLPDGGWRIIASVSPGDQHDG